MSLARGKYGIEYNPRQLDENRSSGLGWLVVVVVLLTLGSLAWALYGRLRSGGNDGTVPDRPLTEEKSASTVEKPKPVVEEAPPKPPVVEPPPVVAPVEPPNEALKRPAKVRNLLMRLEAAEKAKDIEMEVSTIETIRALPGLPAADLDDKLARRLGTLNVLRLFALRNAQWVTAVTVKRGDSASRIASEHGSTLASLVRLNGGNVDRVVIGKKLYVMNHPRFNLVVHRRLRTADLSLNGKFFKRYDLEGDVGSKPGAYEFPERRRTFWTEFGIRLRAADRAELELLLPVKTPVLVSEM